MAKEPIGDKIMSPGEMKPILAVSKREPVSAAIGLTKDGDGLILLDKKAKPKRVFAMLKSAAAKAKIDLNTASVRFGRAEVDTDYDPSMVRFFVNKDTPGTMRVKLVEVVKRIPYQKVEINVDPSLEEESEEQEAQEDVPPGQSATTSGQTTTSTPPVVDMAALRRELAELIGRIGAAGHLDVTRLEALKQLAAGANHAIQGNDATAARSSMDELRSQLDAAPPPAPPPPPIDAQALRRRLATLIGSIAAVAGENAGLKAQCAGLAAQANDALKANALQRAVEAADALQKALDSAAGPARNTDWSAIRSLWQDASEAADKQIAALQAALRSSGNDVLEEIAEFGMNGLTGNHKVPLQAAMLELGRGDPTAIAKGRQAALQAARGLRTHLENDERVLVCDENPFGVAVSLRATLGAALTQIEAALQAA